ncbi:hypothetical protein AAF712_002975 [Marasmius tenuissimus]|uniref:Uncharacterized protein n=1 Tax=Marasmius tenuissimus TaxID=585030 RepID=A0ABR3A8R3_9AGAR
MSHHPLPDPQTDLIVSTSPAIEGIIRREKTNHECRPPSGGPGFDPMMVQRIWFYVTAPESNISYICEARFEGGEEGRASRRVTDAKSKGKTKMKNQNDDSDALKFSVISFYRLHQPLPFAVLKKQFGIKSTPRGPAMAAPQSLMDKVTWQAQQLVWTTRPRVTTQTKPPDGQALAPRKRIASVKRKISEMDVDDGAGDIATRPMIKRRRSLRVASRNASGTMAMSVVMKNPSYDAMDVD